MNLNQIHIKANNFLVQNIFFASDQTISFELKWAQKSWVYVYIYSDAANSKIGFGGYAPELSPALREYSEGGTFDMASYEGNHHLRVGSKNNGVQIVTTVRKLAVFKGLAISEGSSSPSITDVLDCKIALKSRPRLSQDTSHYHSSLH